MRTDLPPSGIPSGGDGRKRFLEEAQAAADYISKNVKGRMVPVSKVIRNVNVPAEGERPAPDEPEQRESGETS